MTIIITHSVFIYCVRELKVVVCVKIFTVMDGSLSNKFIKNT
jgi:hypothetical protein